MKIFEAKKSGINFKRFHVKKERTTEKKIDTKQCSIQYRSDKCIHTERGNFYS